ncbi:hypothetical protein BHE74_00016272 [Ensete ventricosum]|nr:hypothetical protein GW17_00055455 [Ensete ventricosum]RWW75684.1 hypothetical protein BHE74_00016272 [Ensete ventricosum]RZR95350.1 hypothetical protein BHM03_00024183 [Ensete ventricosum]
MRGIANSKNSILMQGLVCEQWSIRGHLKEAKENIIDVSLATRWQRPCMRVAVCLSIDQGELLGEHRGVEAGGRKGRGSNDKPGGAQLPKSRVSVGKEVNSEEYHSAVEVDLPIAKKGVHM